MTVTNWIEHLSAAEVQDSIYPGAGSIEGLLVLLGVVLWIGWHIIASKQESSKLTKLARRKRGSNDWKSNVADG